ncbi:MAG: hypothetical protein CM15mV22_0290 [Eurybiavirus sp.]|nr:MAG: hypothetical protein CM15mV22_0290 [Eurybiavirus sp.]
MEAFHLLLLNSSLTRQLLLQEWIWKEQEPELTIKLTKDSLDHLTWQITQRSDTNVIKEPTRLTIQLRPSSVDPKFLVTKNIWRRAEILREYKIQLLYLMSTPFRTVRNQKISH